MSLKENVRWDNNFGLGKIVNMNETLLFINIPNTKTIAKLIQKKLISNPMDNKGLT